MKQRIENKSHLAILFTSGNLRKYFLTHKRFSASVWRSDERNRRYDHQDAEDGWRQVRVQIPAEVNDEGTDRGTDLKIFEGLFTQ